MLGVDETFVRSYVTLGFIFPASVTCMWLVFVFYVLNEKLLYVGLVLDQNEPHQFLAGI